MVQIISIFDPLGEAYLYLKRFLFLRYYRLFHLVSFYIKRIWKKVGKPFGLTFWATTHFYQKTPLLAVPLPKAEYLT